MVTSVACFIGRKKQCLELSDDVMQLATVVDGDTELDEETAEDAASRTETVLTDVSAPDEEEFLPKLSPLNSDILIVLISVVL